jgi:hypothetical protein
MRSTESDSTTGFEDWLRKQFSLTLSSERGPRPRPADARYAAAWRTAGTGFTAVPSSRARPASPLRALTTRAVAAGALAVLAAGGATAAIAATGSVSPINWGQRVVQAVEQCKDEVRGPQGPSQSDAHPGIGQCVSAVAREQGEQQRSRHAGAASPRATASPAQSPSPGKHLGQAGKGPAAANGNGTQSHGKGPAQPKGPGNGNGGSQGNGSQGRPTPAAAPG